MSRALIVIGGGEHARVVIDAARTRPETWSVVGFIDQQSRPTLVDDWNVPWLGDDAAGLALARARRDVSFVIGIGGAEVREAMASAFAPAAPSWATVVHAAAVVSARATLAPGAVVLATAVVGPGARVGEHAIVNNGAIVEHDVELGAFTHVAPRAVIGGGARVGARVFLGLGCAVRDHVTIGDGARVAMGAAVVGSLAAGAKVRGIPARPDR